MNSFTGERKSSSASENITIPTFYTNKLPPSTNLPNDPFAKSAELSKKSIQDNPYDQRTNQDTCPHDISENWNTNQCADCGHTNIGGTRVADEKRFAEIAKIEDHQYLLDELKPILGSMQVTRATKPGKEAGTLGSLGTGTLLELRESNTIAVVAFDCNPICRAILEREKYQYVEQDQKCHVVIPCLELKEFKDCHARRSHGLGITVQALIAFGYKHDCWNWPTYKVMRDIILPATRETRCRYADLPELKDCFGPATVFMSHCWGAKFGDLIGAACHGARTYRVVWIDIFAVRQWPGNVADLDFRGVVSRCKALVVSTSAVDGLKRYLRGPGHWSKTRERREFWMSDEGKTAKKNLPFFRLWCIVELTAAIILNVPIVVKGGSVTSNNGIYEYDTICIGQLMSNLMEMIDVEASECKVPADKIREMAVVHSLEDGSKGVNALIVGVVHGARLSILEIDACVCNEPESLRALNIPLGCEGEERNLARIVLEAACAGGRASVVNELLLKWSVKEDDDQNKEWLIQLIDYSRVLCTASGAGHVGVVERLLEVVGINVNDYNPLRKASFNGHTKVVKALLAAKDINVYQKGINGTPLDIATKYNHTEVIQLLKDFQIDVFVKNEPELFLGSEGKERELAENVLFQACSEGRESVVKELLLKWSVKEDDVQVKVEETKRNDDMNGDFNLDSEGDGTDFETGDACWNMCMGHCQCTTQAKEKEKQGIVYDENDGRLYYVCIDAYGIGCRNSPKLDDRHEENIAIFNLECIIGTLTEDGQWIRIVESDAEDGQDVVDTFVPMTIPGRDIGQDIVFKRITTKMEWIALEKEREKKEKGRWLIQLIDDSAVLGEASSAGHVGVVERLLEVVGIDVNVEYGDSTPLYMASEYGYTKVVKALLAAKDIDVNQAKRHGDTPLDMATENNHTEIIQLLKDAGAQYSLYYASKNGHTEVVKALLAAKDIYVDQADIYGRTPLDIATKNNHTEVIQLLKDAGAQHCSLYIASKNGYTEVVKALLAVKDINVNQADGDEYTPLDIATKINRTEIIQLLKDAGAKYSLYFASKSGNVEEVKALLAAKDINVNQIDRDGRTPFYHASEKGHTEVVTALLAAKDIDVNQADRYGNTPLSKGIENGNTKIVKALLAAKDIDVNKTEKINGDTPLDIATRKNHTEIIQLLIDAGARYHGDIKREEERRAPVSDRDSQASQDAFDQADEVRLFFENSRT